MDLSWDEIEVLLRCLRAGKNLSSTELTANKRLLKDNESDLCARLKLIGYCLSSRRRQSRFSALVKWLVDNDPSNQMHEYIFWTFGVPEFDELKKSWMKQLAKSPTDVQVLNNAAKFFYSTDLSQSQKLWKKAEQLDPLNDKWPMCLANVFSLKAIKAKGTARQVLIDSAIASGERALELHTLEHARCHLHIYRKMFVEDLVKLAQSSNRTEDADRLSRYLL